MFRAVIVATAGLAASCASLTVVDKTPDRNTVAELIIDQYRCVDISGDDQCDPGEQPALIDIASLDCRALPLRTGVREAAHARCAFSGAIHRVSGRADTLALTEREFSLAELTPGARVPERAWTLVENAPQP